MPRPTKVQAHCRRLAATSSAASVPTFPVHQPQFGTGIPDGDGFDSSGSSSDEDIAIVCDDIDISADSLSGLKADIPPLVWKDGGGASLRSVYTGNSRTTMWRNQCRKRQRHESVKEFSKITDFFRPIARRASFEASPLAMPVDIALQMLSQACVITPTRYNKSAMKLLTGN